MMCRTILPKLRSILLMENQKLYWYVWIAILLEFFQFIRFVILTYQLKSFLDEFVLVPIRQPNFKSSSVAIWSEWPNSVQKTPLRQKDLKHSRISLEFTLNIQVACFITQFKVILSSIIKNSVFNTRLQTLEENLVQDVWWRRNPETYRNVVFLRKIYNYIRLQKVATTSIYLH